MMLTLNVCHNRLHDREREVDWHVYTSRDESQWGNTELYNLAINTYMLKIKSNQSSIKYFPTLPLRLNTLERHPVCYAIDKDDAGFCMYFINGMFTS